MARSTDPFSHFDSSHEVTRLAVMMYVRYPLSLRNVEDFLSERRIGSCHKTVRFWWNRFGPIFAADIRRKSVDLGSSRQRYVSRHRIYGNLLQGIGNSEFSSHQNEVDLRASI
jgi:transposase-like protein